MTTFRVEEITCIDCGDVTQQMQLNSTSAFGFLSALGDETDGRSGTLQGGFDETN
jgi:hypothetical protein